MISEDDVPDSWEIKKIGDIFLGMDTGNTPRRSNDNFWGGDVRWAKAGEISSVKKYISETDEKITQNASQSTYGENHVFVTIIGAGLGSAAIPTSEMAINQQNVAVKLNEKMKREYFYHYINSISDYLNSLGRGGGQQAINQTVLKDVNIPVPPLDEQERIVEAVEGRLNRIERLEQSVENIGRLTEEYKDSLLSYLFTGRSLSQEKNSDDQEWLEQIPEGWDVRELREIGSRISSMIEPESGNKYSLYSFNSVDDGSGYYEVDEKDIGSRKRELSGGEVMISRLNPRINRVQTVDDEHKYPPIASSEFVAIDVESYVIREYLYEFLTNPILQDRLTNHVTGSTGSRSRVGFDFVMDSKIPVPPESTQKEIVKKIREVDFTTLERSRSNVSKLSDEYRNSVLSYAFRGEFDY